MEAKKISIEYLEFRTLDELSEQDRKLAEAAIEAQKSSYAPYSHFNVGAAVRLEDDTIVKGSNQENAAYPSGLCAERTAMFAAGAAFPDKAIVSLALAGGPKGTICDSPASPCGSCRQVMAEYQVKGNRPISILMVGKEKIYKFEKVDDLLPFIFDSLDK